MVKTLRADDMERFRAVPRTVMINQWQDDLEWIVIDRTYPEQIRRRLEIVSGRKDMVIDRMAEERVHDAELELRDAVVDYLLAAYPQYFRRADGLILSPLTGVAVDTGPAGADPLVAVALLATEDMLLLLPEQREAGSKVTYALKAGALLFPNDWALRSHFRKPQPKTGDLHEMEAWRKDRQRSLDAARLGKSPYEIHDRRVSHYMEHFASRVDLFLDRMRPGMRAWRRNWAPKMTSELFLHSDAVHAAVPPMTPQNWEQYGCLRSEQQTFAKLPRSGAVVFSIKTYLWKLSEVVGNRAALEALIEANDNLSAQMYEYRRDVLSSFREFLDRHRRPSPGGA